MSKHHRQTTKSQDNCMMSALHNSYIVLHYGKKHCYHRIWSFMTDLHSIYSRRKKNCIEIRYVRYHSCVSRLIIPFSFAWITKTILLITFPSFSGYFRSISPFFLVKGNLYESACVPIIAHWMNKTHFTTGKVNIQMSGVCVSDLSLSQCHSANGLGSWLAYLQQMTILLDNVFFCRMK